MTEFKFGTFCGNSCLLWLFPLGGFRLESIDCIAFTWALPATQLVILKYRGATMQIRSRGCSGTKMTACRSAITSITSIQRQGCPTSTNTTFRSRKLKTFSIDHCKTFVGAAIPALQLVKLERDDIYE